MQFRIASDPQSYFCTLPTTGITGVQLHDWLKILLFFLKGIALKISMVFILSFVV